MATTMAFSMNNSSAGWNATLRGAPLLSARGVAGYWGYPTATVDWCEINYTHSPYIAEFWNTISNVLFVVFGIYGFSRSSHQNVEWRFRLLFVSMAVIGLGSAMFHGTLQLIHQQFDETPMIWGMLVWIYTLYDDEIRSLQIPDRVVIASMFVFGIGFAVLHAMYNFTIGFQLLFATMAFSCLGRLAAHYRTVTDTRARALARLAMFSALLGFAFWMVDYNLCSELASLPFNPQGHAWWHVLMSISTYSSPVFMQFIHAARQQKHAEIVSAPFGLKTIVIHDAQIAAKKNV